jgi:hypothetical protein
MTQTREALDQVVDAEAVSAPSSSRPLKKPGSTAFWAHAVALTLLAAAIIGSGSFFARHLLNSVGGQIVWLNMIAVTLCAFAAALCLTRWSSPPTRVLGLFLCAFTVYQFDSIANYAPTHHEFVVVSTLTWPAIPLCFVLWTRAALRIVALTPTDDAPGRGLSASLVEMWQLVQRRPRRLRASSLSILEPVAIWIPATLFLALGFVPGVLFTYGGKGEAWRGWRFEPRLGFFVMCVWGVLVALGCTALLFASWRRRAPYLLSGVDERARWAPRATMGLALFLFFAFFSTLGTWPVAVFDLLIAGCAMLYALLAIDADSYGDMGAAYASFRQRLLAATLWCGMTLAIVALTEPSGDPLVRGLLAAIVATVLPLGMFLGQELRVVESRTIEGLAPAEGGESIAAELSAPLTAPVVVRARLGALERTVQVLEEIDSEDLKALIGGLAGPSGRRRSEVRDPRSDARLRAFVRDFPALDCSRSWEVRLMRLNKLVYETARPRIGFDVGISKDDPGRWRALAAYCLLRLDPGDRSIDQLAREERLRLRVWLKGERTGLSFYDDLEQLNEQGLRVALHGLAGEETAQRRKKVLERALDATLKQVIAHWSARAEHALGERLPATYRGARGELPPSLLEI